MRPRHLEPETATSQVMATCAWCGTQIEPTGAQARRSPLARPAGAGPAVSHGICRPCLARALRLLPASPAVVTRPALAAGH